MNEQLQILLSLLQLENKKDIYQGLVRDIQINEADDSWFFDIEFTSPLDVEHFELFHERFQIFSKKKNEIKHATYKLCYKKNDYSLLQDYYDYVLRQLAVEKPRFSSIVDFDIEQKENRLKIVCPEDGTFVKDLLYEIRRELANLGFDAYLSTRVCDKQPLIQDRISKQKEEFHNEVMQTSSTDRTTKTFEKFENRAVRDLSHVIEDIPKTEQQMEEYKDSNGNAVFRFEGEVTSSDVRQLNRGTMLFLFIVSSDADSIYVKRFSKNKEEQSFLSQVKTGMLLRVKGVAEFDTYQGEVSINATVIEHTNYFIQKDKRKDLLPDKRIELHLHTKMSTLDGITSAKEYVRAAKRFGHEAIAVTDHGTVQSFPDLFHATQGSNVKPIYGVELTFIDEDDLCIVKDPTKQNINDVIYTVFDIETTGLSVNYDKIIEIAAVKIKNNQIIEEYQTYVNPEIPISELTTKITSIKNSDVALAPTIDQVIREFKVFAENTVMVAHNAHFDMGFIYHTLKEFDLFDEVYPTIDTLQIARSIYNDRLKRFNLKAVSRMLKVHLQQHHRAIYDTRATADVFLHMLRDLRKLGVKQLRDLNEIALKSSSYKHVISKHINLLVKNKTGLKNLYTLISKANTTHFYKEPRLLKRVLQQYREGLLVGSGCMNSTFFEIALNKDINELRQRASFYDYLEVQAPSDFSHFEEQMQDAKGRIQDTIKRIIQVGKELSIPVVATGDVHHLLKEEVKYRDIYVQTPAVGGGLHPLARYEEIPSQYYRTTQEMLDEFSFLEEKIQQEIVITNTHKINKLIDSFDIFTPKLFAPEDDFLALEGVPSIENKLIQMVGNHARKIFGDNIPKIVEDRIEKEITSITKHKFSTVYYISHLLVKKSLDEGYLVGSRGSVGSSLVAMLMDITEVNPLPPHYVCPNCHFSSFKMTTNQKVKYGVKDEEIRLQSLLEKADSGFDLPNESCPICNETLHKDGHSIPFETFLGFKGDKVPDIDLNFSGDYQPVVHEYIRSIFGKERAFRAGTISTVANKTAYGYVKGYLEKKQVSMRKAEIERRANQIVGVKRSTGQHPGGIVVVPKYKDIYDVTPVQYPADDTSSNWRTTHFDYHSFEENLFKLDVLGHDDPTMIRFLMDYVKEHPIDFEFTDARDIPVDDENLYKMLHSTEVIGLSKDDINSEVASFGIPEMGTSFVRSMLQASRPKTFAETVKISGLSHGTDVWLNNAEVLVTGKNKRFGKIPFSDVIGCRDDIMVYLIENGMNEAIAFEISEFIRKGKPAKQPDQWEVYKQAMQSKNIPDWYIWSAGQIKYMFPKAHATAYVLMAMRIAWFKLYKPLLFYSAYFSIRASDYDVYALKDNEYSIVKRMNEITDPKHRATDKENRLLTVLEVALEMVKRNMKFKPISLEESEATEFVMDEENNALILPFITVDGLGFKVAESIVKARKEKEFQSKEDVRERTQLSKTLFTKLDMLDVFDDLPEDSQLNLFEM